jgi:chondroitin-sulfate-ABC endolyase/exolyase
MNGACFMTRFIGCLFLAFPLVCCAAVPLVGTSFEHEADLSHFTGSGVEVVSDRSQFGSKSLKWNGGELTVSDVRSLSPEESGSKYGSHFPLSPHFVMSLYNENPVKDHLRVEFNGEVHFDLKLDFAGWRTVWVPFHEMQGNVPEPEASFPLESVRFSAPMVTLWFDDIVFCQYIDDRHPYPGLEVPFIKEGGAHVRDHWMPKLPHWKMLEAVSPADASATEMNDLALVEKRISDVYLKTPGKPRGMDWFRKQFNFKKPLKLGQQVTPVRYSNPEYADLRGFGELMLKLANKCLSSGSGEAVTLFMDATEYYLDQGWSAGSSQGSAHHIGYNTRELHTAFFLMKGKLKKQGLLDDVGNSVRWQLNFGEMLDPTHLESNLDYYNTQSVFRLMASFLASDPAVQVAFLKAYSQHLSAALALTNSQGFRPDGTAWHHYGHYPAYATGALDRIPVSLQALSGTCFRIEEAGHANFKRAFLAATIYSNPLYWGIGQAGRHPLGGNIGKLQDACLSLALSGTPDGKQMIDAEVASAYARLWGDPGLDCALDPAVPNGHWTFPYAALSVHRRSDWSVNIKGYSKYVWASEIYNMDNRYGRYQSSGVVQVLPNLSQDEAGYREAGWDWNHPPGATTIERSFAELEPVEPLVMFKSVESYAGGCALNSNGVWAMKLNEADGFTIDPVKKEMSFPGNLKARKSVFCFGGQLLCLGSGIESDDPSAPVHTTLFQNGIKQVDDTLYDHGNGLYLDPVGNGYKILDNAKVVVTVGEQSSPNNKYSLRAGKGKKGALPAESGLFAKAWIDHGNAPQDGAYAYVLYPMIGSVARIAEFPSLEIVQQNNAVHIVKDSESQTMAYACFDAGEVREGLLETVSVPCYVMVQEGKTLTVAVANPDLNQHEDPVKGHFKGDSNEAPVTLVLAGHWKVKGVAEAWAETDGESTLLTVKCIDGKSTKVTLEKHEDRRLFEEAVKQDWATVFSDEGSSDWKAQWLLDGEFASVKNTPEGMMFSAGPEEWNHAHHAVLWTKEWFKGDLKIEYDYTRIDDVHQWVNILYIQATGKGSGFAPDIMEWADFRKEPWMKHYFENMKLLHISYAAYGRDDNGVGEDYVRCRRYPKAEKGEFSKTEIKPDSFRTGLFHTGKTYHITAIKKGSRLFFDVEGDGSKKLFAWESPLIGEVNEGRIGLRHMWMRAACYRNFNISVLEN